MRERVGTRMRQVVDWSAAFWAGIISGTAFLLLNMLLTGLTVGSPWIYIRMTAAILMGDNALPPPATFDISVVIVGLLVHYFFSILFACLIAIIVYRWGLIVGILGGAALGLALYAINVYAVSYFFPWFYSLKSWMMLASHLVYGALAGGVYELLEEEEFVPVDK